MAKQATPFSLTKTARRSLNDMLHKGRHSARTLNRARILLKLDQGLKTKDIAEQVGVCLATVYNTRNKAHKQGWQKAIVETKRPGRPRSITAQERARVTALACSDPPEGRSRWTLRLLADRAVALGYVEAISHDSVKRILKKTD